MNHDIQDIMFMINVQHDCRAILCKPTSRKPVVQEHEITMQTVSVITHTDDMFYVINLAALYNAALLRESLSHHLMAPQPLHIDRHTFHDQLTTSLCLTQPLKHEASKAKAASTRKANKEKKNITLKAAF
ncbi:hypothetical protein K439DRAFT_1340119 [Ramaria rubella]|nr:hypothetical protein K439DRAFT_1340119 [Ramaria rubella]